MRNRQSSIDNLQSSDAFTLVELILVAAVLVILVATAVPRFRNTARRLQAEQAAFELAQHLRGASAYAVAQQQVIRWVWDDKAHSAYLELLSEVGEPTPLSGRIARTSPLPDDLSVEFVEVDKLQFLPDGTSDAATLIVSVDSHVYTVTVDAVTSQVVISAGAPSR